jgi:hypothetical protein
LENDMRHTLGAVAVCIVSLAGGILANAAAAESSLEDVAWLAGSWHGEGLGGTIEEHWTEASGGTMTGMFRLVVEGQIRVIEYVMITQEEDRITYRFKHFRPDYTTWEADRPLEFTLISATPTEAVFHSEVPDQHAPRRITYRLVGEGELAAIVTGSDDGGQLAESFEVRFTRR